MFIRNRSIQIATMTGALALAACAKNSAPAASADEPTAETKSEGADLAPAMVDSDSYYVEGVAGGVMSSTLELEAEVISVDQEKRQAVLRGPGGNEIVVSVGKDAVNFYQVAPGDRVMVAMARELVVYVAGEGDDSDDGTAVASARAEQGDTPAGVVVASSKITAKIAAMDLEARTATLSFPDGASQVFQVRPDIDMTQYQVGQDVVFLITEHLALEVKKL